MKIINVKIAELKKSEVDIKQGNFSTRKHLENSFLNYGQVYPITINKNNLVIKGWNLAEVMKKHGHAKICAIVVDIQTDIEIFKFKKRVFDSQDDLNVLKLALSIKNISDTKGINAISEETGIHITELANYIDLLKLDNLLRARKQNKQKALF